MNPNFYGAIRNPVVRERLMRASIARTAKPRSAMSLQRRLGLVLAFALILLWVLGIPRH